MSSGDVWIIGTAMTPFGRFADKDLIDLASEATLAALGDAGMAMADIGVLAVGNVLEASSHNGQRLQKQIGQTGIPVYNVVNACATGATATPVNVSGGLLPKGHPLGATGIANIFEVTTHLRGEAGGRQIEGARVGLTHVIGLASACAHPHTGKASPVTARQARVPEEAAMPPRQNTPAPDTITDPVEWAGHYWHQQQLEGDEQRFLVMSSLLRYQRIVVELVDGELRKLDLNMTDYLMLMTLQLSESGTRMISSLARNLMVHATTATLATDRLEGRELLRRSPHPTDRRATCVTITAAGRELAHKATIALGTVDFGLAGAIPASVGQLGELLVTLRAAAGDTGPRA